MTQLPHLRVATWNVYLGADIERLLVSDPEVDIVSLAAELLSAARDSRFAERAEAMASLIAEHRPDVIGLQELGRWEGGETESSDGEVLWNYQEILLDALTRKGAAYLIAHCVDTFSSRLPVDGEQWARFTSCDALLLRQDPDQELAVMDIHDGHFSSCLDVEVSGREILVRRGWVAVDLEVDDQPFRVVVTHLDSMSERVRRQQAHELVSLLSDSEFPVVVVGDMNSSAEDRSDPESLMATSHDGTLEVLARAGYADAWIAAGPGNDRGFTWGSDHGVRGERELTQRLDYVFYDPEVLSARDVSVIGVDPGDRTMDAVEPLWPSDHGCVIATVERKG